MIKGANGFQHVSFYHSFLCLVCSPIRKANVGWKRPLLAFLGDLNGSGGVGTWRVSNWL